MPMTPILLYSVDLFKTFNIYMLNSVENVCLFVSFVKLSLILILAAKKIGSLINLCVTCRKI